jgi:hypothetical protein
MNSEHESDWVSGVRTRIQEITTERLKPHASPNALQALNILSARGMKPLRVDVADDDCISFTFALDRRHGTVDCYDNGELVVAYSGGDDQCLVHMFECVNEHELDKALHNLRAYIG